MFSGLLLLAQVQGHVKFFFSDDTHDLLGRPIRNAPGAMSDGVMSTSGPCGGDQNNWGANGFSYGKEGDTITMKINYNGGHKSAANLFRAAWNCAADGTNDLPQGSLLPNAAGVAEPSCTISNCPETPVAGSAAGTLRCGAAIGNDNTGGYIFHCDVPAGAAGKNCSMSVLDQRDWGGCYDLMIDTNPPPQAIGGGATPSPIPNVDTTVIGMYLTTQAEDATKIENAPAGSNCCTLAYGSFFVFEMDGGMQVIADVKAACDGESFVHNSVVELVKDTLGPVWRADISMGVDGNEQTYELSLSNGMMLITQLDPALPQFCDFAVSRKSVGNSGDRPVLSAAAMFLTILSSLALLF